MLPGIVVGVGYVPPEAGGLSIGFDQIGVLTELSVTVLGVGIVDALDGLSLGDVASGSVGELVFEAGIIGAAEFGPGFVAVGEEGHPFLSDDGFEDLLAVAAGEGSRGERLEPVDVGLGRGLRNHVIVHRGLDAGAEVFFDAELEAFGRPSAQNGFGFEEEAFGVAEPNGGPGVVEPVVGVEVARVGFGVGSGKAVGQGAHGDVGGLCASVAAAEVVAETFFGVGQGEAGHSAAIPADEAAGIDGFGLVAGAPGFDAVGSAAGAEVAVVLFEVVAHDAFAVEGYAAHGQGVFASAGIHSAKGGRGVFGYGLHVVGVAGHEAIPIVEGRFGFGFCAGGVDVGDAQCHAKTEGVGEAEPLVGVAEVADVVAVDFILGGVFGVDAVGGLLEEAEHGVVNLGLGVVGYIVGLRHAGTNVLAEGHGSVGVGVGQGQEDVVDAGDVEHVAVARGGGVELEGAQKVAVFAGSLVVEVPPAGARPSVAVVVVGGFSGVLGLVVGDESAVDVVGEVGGELVVVVVALVKEVAEARGGVGEFGLEFGRIFFTDDEVDVDVGVFGVILYLGFLLRGGAFVGQFVRTSAQFVEVVATGGREHDGGREDGAE